MKGKKGYGSEPGERMLPPSSLGKEIRKLRLERPGHYPLSQREFGKMIGLSNQMVSRIERGIEPLLDKYIPILVKKFKLSSLVELKFKKLAKLQRTCNPIVMPYTERMTRNKMNRVIKQQLEYVGIAAARRITKAVLEAVEVEKKKSDKKRLAAINAAAKSKSTKRKNNGSRIKSK